MMKVRIILDDNGMFPATEHFCPVCGQLHHFYSIPQKECVKCGIKFWNVRELVSTLSCRIGYYRGVADDKSICKHE